MLGNINILSIFLNLNDSEKRTCQVLSYIFGLVKLSLLDEAESDPLNSLQVLFNRFLQWWDMLYKSKKVLTELLETLSLFDVSKNKITGN